MTSHALGGLAGSRRTLRMQAGGGHIAAILTVWRYIRNPLRQTMRIYLRNNPAKIHPDPICNGIRLFWRALIVPTRSKRRWVNRVTIWDQVQKERLYACRTSYPSANRLPSRTITISRLRRKLIGWKSSSSVVRWLYLQSHGGTIHVHQVSTAALQQQPRRRQPIGGVHNYSQRTLVIAEI